MNNMIDRAAVAKAITDLAQEFLAGGSPTAVKVLNLVSDRIAALPPAPDAVEALEGVTDLISRMEMASGLSADSYLLACVKDGMVAIIALSEKNAALAAQVAELTRERDEALRRRDTWKAKAEGYDEMAAAVRVKVKAEPATMSRLLLKAALIESEAKVARLEGALHNCVGMLDQLVAESGRGIEWDQEDPFRRGEWFEPDDLKQLAQARAALTDGGRNE